MIVFADLRVNDPVGCSPLDVRMLMAFFVIHGADPFAVRELPLLYLGVYVFLLWGGAGSYSLDEWIRRRIIHREIAR